VNARCVLAVITALGLGGCALPPRETGNEFLAGAGVRALPGAEVAARLTNGVLIDEALHRRYWHGPDETIINLDTPEGADLSRGRWTFDALGRYCRYLYVGPGQAGACGRFYEREGRLYFVGDGTGTRKHLFPVRIEKAPAPTVLPAPKTP